MRCPKGPELLHEPMPVPVLFHPACRLHNPGAGHPERPERIEAVLAALRAPDLASVVEWREARPAAREQIERVHPARYLDGLRSEEHTSELQSLAYLVCRLLLE